MEKKIDEISTKLDKVIEDNNQQNILLAKLGQILEVNTESLIKHEKRTTISEDRLHQFEIKFEKHLSFLKGSMYVLTGGYTILKAGTYILEHVKF